MTYKYKVLPLSVENVQKILNTLPLSYYFGKIKINVKLDIYTSTSYINLYKDEIVIAYQNIISASGNSGKAKETTIRALLYHELSHAMLTPEFLKERFSSANYPKYQSGAEINVFEDERIETINRNYFLGVDFRQNILDIAHYNPNPKSAFEYYFNVVRFHKTNGHEELLDDMLKIIKYASSLNRYNTNKTRLYVKKVSEFIEKVYDIFNKELANTADNSNTKKDENQENQENQNAENTAENGTQSDENPADDTDTTDDDESAENGENESESDESETDDADTETETKDETKDDDETNEQENTTDETNESKQPADDENAEKDETTKEDTEKDEAENGEEYQEEDCNKQQQALSEFDEEFSKKNKALLDDIARESKNNMLSAAQDMKKAEVADYGLKPSLDFYQYRREFKTKAMLIIAKTRGFGIQESTCTEGYCGNFNPELKMIDFEGSKKWWSDEEDEGERDNLKNKVVLNIWLDNSGSFEKNDDETNVILRGLQELERERSDFQFNLVTFNDNFTLKNGDERVSHSKGCNRLPKAQIVPLYKKLNPTGNEYNIMLFDGLAGYSRAFFEGYEEYKDMLSFDNLYQFNNRRTTFIAEEKNITGLKESCPKANLIIENDNYTKRLEENVIKALEMLF